MKDVKAMWTATFDAPFYGWSERFQFLIYIRDCGLVAAKRNGFIKEWEASQEWAMKDGGRYLIAFRTKCKLEGKNYALE